LDAISVERVVRADQRKFFGERLNGDQAVKRIAMMMRQAAERLYMLNMNCKYFNFVTFDIFPDQFGNGALQIKFPQTGLDDDFLKTGNADQHAAVISLDDPLCRDTEFLVIRDEP
jgi:hypothetical protein